MVSFVERLQQLIQEKKVTVDELSKETKISKKTLLRYVNGESENPNNDTFMALKEYFNVTLDYLFGLDDIRKWVFSTKDGKVFESSTGNYDDSCVEYVNYLVEIKEVKTEGRTKL